MVDESSLNREGIFEEGTDACSLPNPFREFEQDLDDFPFAGFSRFAIFLLPNMGIEELVISIVLVII